MSTSTRMILAGCRSSLAVAVLLCFCPAARASAQSLSVGDPFEDYVRLLQLTGRAHPGSFTVRPFSRMPRAEESVGAAHPWSGHLPGFAETRGEGPAFGMLDPQLDAFANSRFPTGQNDGAVWQGRGVTTSLQLGARATWRGLSVTLRPRLLYTENRSFELAPVEVDNRSEFAYPWHIIDLPQRFGPEAFWTVDPGESEARVNARGATLGVGTRTLWWGPALRNAIIMSNNAPGFPHAFLGTDGPASTGVGAFEATLIWGRLQHTDWFDPSFFGDEGRFITGVVGTYSPSFLGGLTLGITRVFTVLVQESGVPLENYFAVFSGVRKKAMITPSNPTGDDPHDQLASLFGRWVLENSGFEVYWEWARNDHSWELRDYLLEPEHSQAYTLGLQKGIELSDRRLIALRAELTHLEADATFQVRPKGTYYQHAPVTQGYTHKGQILGAGVGPGGNAQYVGVDMYAPWGRAGLYVERQVHNNDAFYTFTAIDSSTYRSHDVSFHLGGHALRFVGDFDFGAGLVVTREYNRYFFGPDLWNVKLSLSARWRAQQVR